MNKTKFKKIAKSFLFALLFVAAGVLLYYFIPKWLVDWTIEHPGAEKYIIGGGWFIYFWILIAYGFGAFDVE